MWLTQLADLARRTGMPVVEISGWKTRGHGPMQTVQTVTCHHTAGKGDDDWDPDNDDYPSLRVVRDGRPGLDGPLAHFGIGRNTGTIYVIAAGLCYHAGVSRADAYENPRAIGIEAENDGLGEPWGVKMMTSYALLCQELDAEFGLSVEDNRGHKETCAPPGRKSDPTFNMATFRASITLATLPPVEVPPAKIVHKEIEMFTINTTDDKVKFLITGAGKRVRLYDGRQAHILNAAGVPHAGRATVEEISLFPEEVNVRSIVEESQAELQSVVSQAAKAGGTPDEIAARTVAVLTARLAKS